MKSYSKLITVIVGLFGMSRALLAGDVTGYGTYTSYVTNTYALPTYSASNSIATSSSNGVVVALNAQALLLKELMQEHQKRAADLAQKNQVEQAKWESDLVNELQEKSVRVQKNIERAIQPSQRTNDMNAADDVDDQLVFVSTVEARLEELRQEVSGAIEESRVMSMQIGTNKGPEDIANLSFGLSENQRLVKQLQREQLDLELRKLEFKAIRKAMDLSGRGK